MRTMMKKRYYYKVAFLLVILMQTVMAQGQTLTLDECRQLALKNNKTLQTARMQQDIAEDAKKIARTQYLPKVDAAGMYMHTFKEISLLSDDQKALFNNLGTTARAGIEQSLPSIIGELMEKNIITPLQAQGLSEFYASHADAFSGILNGVGSQVTDAFHTDTRNLWAGSITVNQPVFLGGRISALNRIADINQKIAASQVDAGEQTITLGVDKAYWLVVSLRHKQTLADKYCDLVRQLSADVHKMVVAGVATKANELSVNVRVNEAEMTQTQVGNGLTLARMALCQLCGLPIDSDIHLADETLKELPQTDVDATDTKTREEMALYNRPEIKMLENATDIASEGVKIAKADYLPTVLLTAGYTITNPNLYNGFSRKFGGDFNVGVMFRMPLWNWNETKYKVHSAKAMRNIANMELADAKEMIRLQVNQNSFKLTEANKQLATAKKNIASADENLRAATLGFKEGVMTSTNVLEAQTAWLNAQTQKIDAEINLKLTQSELEKTLGILK